MMKAKLREIIRDRAILSLRGKSRGRVKKNHP
jgi:hypothetical protein